jgi:hypothetical protein
MQYRNLAGIILSTAILAGCGGGDGSSIGAVNLQVSASTRAILDSDPAEYQTLPVLTSPGYEFAGRIAPRSTAELLAAGLSNRLMVGGETTDRGFSTFSNWKEFLGPLGATKVRVQPGWNDVEKVITTPPTYDWAKMDEIVDGALAQKVQPYISLGYGNENPGCTNCGTKGLGGKFPTAEGRERWMDFVRAIVTRYKDKVTEWQIWNEPNADLSTRDYYKVFIVDVAKAIKSIQPQAKITIGGFLDTHYVFGCMDCDTHRERREYITTALKYFHDNKGPTVPSADVKVGFHPYHTFVDYDAKAWDAVSMNNFLALVRSYGFSPIMDENGAPSTPCNRYAMCNAFSLKWTQANQVKYNLRRVLGDLGRGIETSMFTITDLHYDDAKNTKGLLETGAWDNTVRVPFRNGDQTVKGKKLAYVAFQNVSALFDSRVTHVANHKCTAPEGYAVYAWQRNDGGQKRTALAAWRKTNLPTEGLNRTDITIECSGLSLEQRAQWGSAPYYVDMMDGRAYVMPETAIIENNPATNRLKLTVPVGDWPMLVADQEFVRNALK